MTVKRAWESYKGGHPFFERPRALTEHTEAVVVSCGDPSCEKCHPAGGYVGEALAQAQGGKCVGGQDPTP